MNYRQLGSTGIKVSEIGFGAWQLGNQRDWGEMSDSKAVRLVHEALDRGCNFFDTAPNYGHGNSEKLLGKALSGRRNHAVINTKFGHHSDGSLNFDPKFIRATLESSLKRLNTDYVDSLLLHNPDFECLKGNTGHFDELEKLKQEGKIRAYGASVDSSREMFELMGSTNSEVIEVMFNIFHQEPKKAFQQAGENGMGLVIKVPLDSGWLSGKYDTDSVFTDIRSRWDAEQLTKRASLLPRLRDVLDPEGPMAQDALRFILSFKEISAIIPGVKNIQQLNINVSAVEKQMNQKKVEELEKMWEEEIEGYPLKW
ncbi:aldo/keto reductase [Neobacillus drentensis]|jgi:aryl-alcohol dehydrogenase-like predicted oxidoreductase|uniref:aldo/keto reductase n=1 Tax=Neobacillus drentensis TaxID=220684 RepID=UPI002FFF166D